jgi:hypothetical protein
MRKRRIAAGRGLGTGLGTMIQYVRRKTSGAEVKDLGTSIKYLPRTRNGFDACHEKAKWVLGFALRCLFGRLARVMTKNVLCIRKKRI